MKLNVKQGAELSRKIAGIVSRVFKTCVAAGLIYFWLWSRSHESNHIHVIGFISLTSCVFATAAAEVVGSKAVGAAWGGSAVFRVRWWLPTFGMCIVKNRNLSTS